MGTIDETPKKIDLVPIVGADDATKLAIYSVMEALKKSTRPTVPDWEQTPRFGYESLQYPLDTSIRPVNPEVDLKSVRLTTLEEKARALPSSVIDVDTSQMTQRELRDLLMKKYPEADFPDIYRILDSGLILTRFFHEERLGIAMMNGTDRDYSSRLAYNSEHVEEEVVRVNGLNRGNVTYLAQQRLSSRSLDGGEPKISAGGLYGNVLLVYDPRQVQNLGYTSSGLSYFPNGAQAALLAIVRFPKQS